MHVPTLIRPEHDNDIPAIAEVTRLAFLAHPYSSHTEEFIIAALRKAGALSISLVAEYDQQVIGHIAFSPVTLSDGSPGWFGLGPMAVAPDHQRKGIGQALVRHGLDVLRERKAAGCVVVGEPEYYGRFGFAANPRLVYEEVPQEYFMTLAFGDALTCGTVAYHAAFEAQG